MLWWRPILAAFLSLGVAGVFLALNYAGPVAGTEVVFVLWRKLWHLFLFVVFWFAVYAFGRFAVSRFKPRVRLSPEVYLAAGTAAAVMVAFALGVCRLYYGWLIKSAVIGGAATGVVFLRAELAAVPARVRRWLSELELAPAFLVVVAVALALSVALMAAEPAIYWDAQTYHLAVPKVYARAHGFAYLPHNVYASMPMGATLFYVLPLLWDGYIAANACHLVASIVALGLCYRVARLWLPQFYGVLASVFVLFTPPFFSCIGGAHADHFQLMFAAAALWCYFGSDATQLENRSRLFLTACFVGAATAVKYTGVAVVIGFVAVWFADVARKKLRVRDALLMGVVAVAFVVPWLGKAYVERGNPVFPLFYDLFGGRDFSCDQARRLMLWQSDIGRGKEPLTLLKLPYYISVEADTTYHDFMGPYLPFLLPLALLGIIFLRRGWRLQLYGWVHFLIWALGSQQLRFLTSALPALATGAAAPLAAAELRGAAWPRRLWRAALCVTVPVVSFPYVGGAIFKSFDGHDYLVGVSAENFLLKRCSFYRAQKFINEELPRDAKVLMVFTNHTLYLERPAVYDSFLEASAFLGAAERARSGEDLYRLARRWGVTHVHVYRGYERRTWPYYKAEARATYYDFLRRFTVLVYEDQFNGVYELLGPGV